MEQTTFSRYIRQLPSLQWIAARMEVMSPPGRRCLNASPWLVDRDAIEAELDNVAATIALGENPDTARGLDRIRLLLMQVKEVRNTFARIAAGERLDDIELFEVKCFALIAEELRECCRQNGYSAVSLPDLQEVVRLLDPQNAKVPHFYIYDDYSAELAAVRRSLKKASATPDNESLTKELFEKASDLEDVVREELSSALTQHSNALAEALDKVAYLDVLQAKAALAARLSLVRPEVTDGVSSFTSLFNPQVEEALASRGKTFQPVSIALSEGATVITGANMAGKSVLLKTVALAQSMAQFGMYVPAAAAAVSPVSDVLLCIGDEQSELSGLSSFASEMLRLDTAIKRLRGGEYPLILVDEPARTTNPQEGKALVDALVEVLDGYRSPSLITTHYSGLRSPRRRLRVKGFTPGGNLSNLRAGDINDYIDYTLVENSDGKVPREAIRIARLLDIDSALTDKAEEYLEQT